jgi:CHRD domain-containing protein
MRSRRAAITASLVGALLIAGVPTLAFGEGDGAHEAKAYSATAASDDVAAQKAKDEDAKKDGEKKDAKKGGDEKKAAEKKNGDKQAADKKNDNKKADEKKAAEKKKADDDRKAADNKKNDDSRKRHDNDGKKDDGKKDADNKKTDDGRKRHDNEGKKGDDGRKDDGDKEAHKKKKADDDKWASDRRDDWRNKHHGDKWDKDWDHDRDRHHRRHHWDTHRRYYRYGYYGPGYYDDCGYAGPYYYGYDDDDSGYRGYDGNYYQGSYYGPDSCSYEYGSYRSHFLVDMSWDQVIPRSSAEEAYGVANLDIDVPAGQVCFRLAYDGIERAIGAQIHPGRLGEVGPAIVLLHVGQNGDDGCVGADPRILSEIQNDPRGYYLEVNDEDHGQAMRGQLDAPDYRNRY